MSEQKLKPCPFCGGEAKLTIMLGRDCISCTNCYAAMIPSYCIEGKDYKEYIAKLWNRRTHETQTTVNQYGSNSAYISGRIENLTL